MVFKKGQSGNPAGGNNELVRRSKQLRDKLTPEADKLFQKLMKHVNSSDESISLSATRDALDRLYGKAMAPIEMSGPEGSAIAVMSATPLSVEQFMLKFAPKVDE